MPNSRARWRRLATHQGTMAFALGLVACGGVSGDPPDAAPIDAAPIDVATVDVPQTIDGAPAACDQAAPFGAPTNLTALNSPESEPWLWMAPDQLTVYVQSNRVSGRVGGDDLWVATRASVSDPFGTPSLVPNVNTTADEGAPILSADLLTMYFTSTRGGNADIYVATRASPVAEFGAPAPVAGVNAAADDAVTWLSPDGTRLYLSSRRDGGDWDLFRATRATATQPFAAPAPIAEANSDVEDWGMVLTADELTAYFESPRAPTQGCYDIYRATRTTVNDGFGAPVKVDELSTALCEFPVWISDDGCRMVIAINGASGGAGAYDLWYTTKPPP